jgi:hypothetical protein
MMKRTILIVSLLVFSSMAIMLLPNAAAADKEYLFVDPNNWPMSNRYVNGGGSSYLGDKGVTFSIVVENNQYEPAWPGSYIIKNVTAQITAVKDINGNPVSNNPLVGRETSVDYAGPITWASATISGFEYDIKDEGVEDTYNLTVRFSYEYDVWDDVNFQYDTFSGTDTDYVYIRIADGVTVGSDVKVFSESDVIQGHYLYAGQTFQKVGVWVSTGVGKVGEVTATISMPTSTKNYITLDQSSAYTSQISSGSGLYFKYRADVKDGTPPGRYEATLKVVYQRYYGDPNERTIMADQIPIEFIVDFTPLLTRSANFEFTFTQGIDTASLDDIEFENIGNTELKKLDLWIDISNYFEQNDFYYYGDGGAKVPEPLRPDEPPPESIPKGSTFRMTFSDINVFRFLPAGEHRLPVQYEGYYYDDGTAGGSSDFKQTDESVYNVIKGDWIYIVIHIVDDTPNFKVESTTSINLGRIMKDVDISVSVNNQEDVEMIYMTVSLSTTATDNTKVFINPKDPAATSLKVMEVQRFYGQTTQWFTFNADVVQGIPDGHYEIPLTLSGINSDTRESFEVTKTITVRVNPTPPKLIVTDISYTEIKPKQEFQLTINVENIGGDTARDVFVNINDPREYAEVSLTTDFMPEVAKAEKALNPFTTEISKIPFDDIPTGGNATVIFMMKADKNTVKGRNYNQIVTIEYEDDFQRSWTYQTEVSLEVVGKQPVKEPENPYAVPLIVGIILIIVIFIIAIIVDKVVFKRRRRFGGAGPETMAEVRAEEPAPRESTLPPPPPSQQQAKAQTFKVCPACQRSVPSSNLTCPHCKSNL